MRVSSSGSTLRYGSTPADIPAVGLVSILPSIAGWVGSRFVRGRLLRWIGQRVAESERVLPLCSGLELEWARVEETMDERVVKWDEGRFELKTSGSSGTGRVIGSSRGAEGVSFSAASLLSCNSSIVGCHEIK